MGKITNEQKLQRLFNLMDDDALTKETFKNSFKQVLDLVKKVKEQNANDMKMIAGRLSEASENVKNATSSDFKALKDSINELNNKTTTGLNKALTEKIAELDKRMSEIKDGVDADEDSVVEKLLSNIKIPTIEEIKDDLPVMGEEVRDSLELLEGDERLKMSAIRGLGEAFKSIKEMVGGIRRSGGGTGGSNQAVQYADLTAQCNGVLKTFTVPRHRMAIQLTGTQFPVIYRPVIDYTTSNLTLTLTSEVAAPKTGQTLTFLYIK